MSRSKPTDIPELVEEHLVKGRVLERLLYREPVTDRSYSHHAGYSLFRSSGTAGSPESRSDRSRKKSKNISPVTVMPAWPKP